MDKRNGGQADKRTSGQADEAVEGDVVAFLFGGQINKSES